MRRFYFLRLIFSLVANGTFNAPKLYFKIIFSRVVVVGARCLDRVFIGQKLSRRNIRENTLENALYGKARRLSHLSIINGGQGERGETASD